MAVIEIAKIQVRRGQENQTGIPQLAGGEFAWAADNETLYIGLKREDGGARDANVRVLTENDMRMFTAFVNTASMNTPYTWEDDSKDSITSTTDDEGTKVVRTLQNKLDDFVNVADFGVIASTGTVVNDCSIELQVAIDNLFLGKNAEGGLPGVEYESTSSPTLQYNKKLYFPAGVYKIGETIFIPRNTVIVGEGIDKTVIEMISEGAGVFQTIDYNERRASNTLGKFDPTVLKIFGPGQPKNIHIEGLTMRYSTRTAISPHLSLLSLDCVDNAVIRQVKFQGTYTSNIAFDPDCTGIDIRGYSKEFGVDNAITSENILIDNCQFTGLYYDVKSNYDTNHIVIQNSSFVDSKYGIGFSTTTNVEATSGPTYSRIINNKFQNIEQEGIYVGPNPSGAATHHVSENNSFIRVGDEGTEGNASNGTAVIKFATPGNASVNDYFGRQTFHNGKLGTAPGSTSTYYPLIDGRATIDLNSVSTATLTAAPGIDTAFSITPIMRLPITGTAQHLTIKYQCVGSGINKAGTLQVYIRPGATPSDIQLVDDYNVYGADGGVFWGIDSIPSSKYFDLVGCNLSLTTVQVELQTKLML